MITVTSTPQEAAFIYQNSTAAITEMSSMFGELPAPGTEEGGEAEETQTEE